MSQLQNVLQAEAILALASDEVCTQVSGDRFKNSFMDKTQADIGILSQAPCPHRAFSWQKHAGRVLGSTWMKP